MKLGLHISTAGNLIGTPARAAAMGAETIQIFASNPRGWRPTFYTGEQGASFQQAAHDAGTWPVFIHMIYLVSYGSGNEELRAKSITALRQTLDSAAQLGVQGIITHLGSHGGLGLTQALERLSSGILEAMGDEDAVQVVLENSAGAGGNIGNGFNELAQIIKSTSGDQRIKVCLDTAHLFGSGYDIRSEAGWRQTLQDFADTVGLDRLVAMHLNDSKAGLSSHVDRHENIGQGQIGKSTFDFIVNDPALANVCGLLEVPGMDGKSGPDQANMEILKGLRH